MFETNTIGTIAMTQAVLPQLRARRSGVVVNVTSTVTLRPLHLLSVYTASKAAVNAFTESLALELEPFGVRARVVLPGRAPDTAFGDNARVRMGMNIPEAYGDIAAQVFARSQDPTAKITRSLDVAEAVWRAATDPSCPMRLPPARMRSRGAKRPEHEGRGLAHYGPLLRRLTELNARAEHDRLIGPRLSTRRLRSIARLPLHRDQPGVARAPL